MPPVAMMPAVDAAVDRRDAGEVRGGHEGETEERGEALPGDDPLAVGEQAAGDPGDERRDREAEHLDEDDVDADARRPSARWPGPRASPIRASSCAGMATPTATTTQTIRHMKPNDRRGNSLPTPDAEVDPEDLGLPDGVAVGLDEIGVAEPDRFDAEREREGDDPEHEAA